MKVKLKTVGYGVIVDARREPAGARQRIAVEPCLQRKNAQLVRCAHGVPPSAAAEPQAKLRETWIHAALQRAQYRSGNAGGVPVHAHHCTVCLKPEWIAQPGEKFRWPVVENDLLGDGSPKLGHPLRKPRRHMSAVERKIGCAGAFH